MSALRSVLDDLAAENLDRLSNDDLVDHLAEIERAVRMLEAERAKAVAEIEERQAYANDGFVSTTAWLVHRLRIPESIAAQQTRLARVLRHMPEANRALAEGAICVSAAALLVAAREEDRAEYERCEQTLVEAARSLSVRELRRVIELLRSLGHAQAADDAARRRFERRGLFISATSTAWCVSTGTSIQKPGRPSSSRFGRSSMRTRAAPTAITADPRSGGQMLSATSAEDIWTLPTDEWLAANARTSR